MVAKAHGLENSDPVLQVLHEAEVYECGIKEFNLVPCSLEQGCK